MLMILAVMTLHSFAEGVAVGVAFGGGERLATLITLAIAVHNVPEGLAISAVMRPKGSSVAACAGWSVFSSLPQPLMAVPAFLFVDSFRALLPYGLGFAAGAMVLMVFLELLPEAYAGASRTRVGLWVSVTLGQKNRTNAQPSFLVGVFRTKFQCHFLFRGFHGIDHLAEGGILNACGGRCWENRSKISMIQFAQLDLFLWRHAVEPPCGYQK